MSRCSDQPRVSYSLVLTVGLAVVAAFCAPPVVAAADPTTQVITIVAPVLDLQFGVSDLDKVVRVESLPTRKARVRSGSPATPTTSVRPPTA